MASDAFGALVSDAAQTDLDQAVAYRLRIEGPKSAVRLLDAFDNAVDRLSEIPDIAIKIGASEYYWLSVDDYVLVYSIDEASHSVRVHRLHYETSNWKSHISGNA